jgi:hypothetical protein
MKIEVSDGEIFDKFTILQIKMNEIKDKAKLVNIEKEYEILHHVTNQIKVNLFESDKNNAELLIKLQNDLQEVNKELWDIEDDIRNEERNKRFGEEFIRLARAVYVTNDKRCDVKKQINILTKSGLVEEKSYEDYQ